MNTYKELKIGQELKIKNQKLLVLDTLSTLNEAYLLGCIDIDGEISQVVVFCPKISTTHAYGAQDLCDYLKKRA